MAIVTDVTKDRRRVHVRLGGRTFDLTYAMYRLRPLEPGDEAEPEEYERWLAENQYKPALTYAMKLLGDRAHSEGELREKLRRVACQPLTVDLVILKLQQLGFVNDVDFAREWASTRATHLGRRRIAEELRRKGISGDVAEQALEELPEEDMAEAALSFARAAMRHTKPGEDPRISRQKVMARLVRRGYSWDEAKEAVAAASGG